MKLLVLLNIIILFVLAILHFYWAVGGKWGLEFAIPIKEDGEKLFVPRTLDSLFVGIFLSIFVIYYFLRLDFVDCYLQNWVVRYIGWIIPMIFILRVIGDFKYIGIFKTIRDTNFGILDTRIYSPICLVIAFLGILIQIL